MTRGRLIAFEGLDQSGKQTQAEWLVGAFREAGHRVHTLSFPDYTTSIGAEIGQELADPGTCEDARQFEDAQAGKRWGRSHQARSAQSSRPEQSGEPGSMPDRQTAMFQHGSRVDLRSPGMTRRGVVGLRRTPAGR